MSYNDGSKLLVFGLSFSQHDSRKMQQVLGHYRKLPDSMNRTVLFAQLNGLARELMDDETRQLEVNNITSWMQHGGLFPTSATNVSFENQASPAPQTLAPARRHDTAYRYRYGQGRTLNGDTQVIDDGDAPYDNDESNGMEDDEFDGMDRLPRWQNAGTRDGFHGLGHQLEDPAGVMIEEAETTQAVEDANTATTEPSGGSLHQDGSMADDADGPHESGRTHNDAAHTDSNVDQAQANVAPREGPSVGVPDAEAEENNAECPICAEEYPVTNFPRDVLVTEACTHPENPCLDCLQASIATVVERGALHLLACPICPAKLTSREVKQYASTQVYERYQYLKQQSEIPGHYISCMNPQCGGSQPHDRDDPRMTCQYCNFATCAHHKRPWHEGQTCSEFDLDDAQLERLEEEEATAKLLSKEETSICPKCGQGVTKTEGCDHMRCACGEEWCYICSCSYENVIRLGATAHATFCLYHPNKVNLTKNQKEAARKKIMGLVHGGEVSAELSKARDQLREKRRAEMRPKLAEAAEVRRRLAMLEKQEGSGTQAVQSPKKKKVKLVAPWEEGGLKKRSF